MMPLHPGWDDLAARIALTVVAGALIGVNRDEHGRPAGLRTMLLVGLAACFAMILANLLVPLAGKASDGFVNLDLMRLPLGILSGMGFLGAGAIVRRTDLVRGVTTAATMWIVTIIGLCFGADQLLLGGVATALTLATLNMLKWVERYIPRDKRATLLLTVATGGPTREEMVALAKAAGFAIARQAVTSREQGQGYDLQLDLRWRARLADVTPPDFLPQLAGRGGVQKLVWEPG